MTNSVTLLLFDIGGVLVELTGVPRLMEWTHNTMTTEEIWEKWLHSTTARSFESGKISPKEFSERIVQEFSLSVPPEQYLEEFIYWPKHLYTGAIKLLDQLTSRYTLASLSNTNHLHWERFTEEMHLIQHFEYNFPSHLTGLLKPDKEAFLNVLDKVKHPAEKILFLDDNRLNVESAKECGMQAYITEGVENTEKLLNKLSFL